MGSGQVLGWGGRWPVFQETVRKPLLRFWGSALALLIMLALICELCPHWATLLTKLLSEVSTDSPIRDGNRHGFFAQGALCVPSGALCQSTFNAFRNFVMGGVQQAKVLLTYCIATCWTFASRSVVKGTETLSLKMLGWGWAGRAADLVMALSVWASISSVQMNAGRN